MTTLYGVFRRSGHAVGRQRPADGMNGLSGYSDVRETLLGVVATLKEAQRRARELPNSPGEPSPRGHFLIPQPPRPTDTYFVRVLSQEEFKSWMTRERR